MKPKAQVEGQTHAQRVGLVLDRNRIETAQTRIRAARLLLGDAERAAAVHRSTIATLCRTWNLCPRCYEPFPPGYEPPPDDAVCPECYRG